MTRQELFRRMKAIAEACDEPTDSCAVRMVPFREGVLVTVDGFGAWSLAARKAAWTEFDACDRAWSAIVVNLCDDLERARKALAAARRFSDDTR